MKQIIKKLSVVFLLISLLISSVQAIPKEENYKNVTTIKFYKENYDKYLEFTPEDVKKLFFDKNNGYIHLTL